MTDDPRYLMDTTGNATKRPRLSSQDAKATRSETPKGRRVNARRGGGIDLDATPKPPATSLPIHADRAFDILEDREILSPMRSDSAASSITSNRSRSPQKKLGDTQFSTVPISTAALNSDNVPSELTNLYQDLHKISSGIEILPGSLKDRFSEARALINTYEWATDSTDDVDGSTSIFFEKAHEIWQLATECLIRGVAEPRWNAEVHCQLLRLALRHHSPTPTVTYEDITTARITDRTLLASIDTVTVQSKLVDYAIILHDEGLKSKIITKLKSISAQAPGTSINCTSAEYIRFDPIAISIETKKQNSSTDHLYSQLGSWVTAHFLKLRQLTSCDTTLPTLPALTAEGNLWKLNLMRWGRTKQGQDHLTVIHYMILGDTSTLSGVYRVVAALRRLAEWVHDDYRLWFERHVLLPEL